MLLCKLSLRKIARRLLWPNTGASATTTTTTSNSITARGSNKSLASPSCDHHHHPQHHGLTSSSSSSLSASSAVSSSLVTVVHRRGGGIVSSIMQRFNNHQRCNDSGSSRRSSRSSSAASASPDLLPVVLLSALAIPLSMLFWTINVAYNFVSPNSAEREQKDDYAVISPWRWLAAVLIPILCALWGLKRKSIDLKGSILGFFMGFILTLTSFSHLACLMAFFFTSSKVSKFRLEKKKTIEELKNGGQRNWIQVLCNGGMAAQLAILYLLDVGCGERPIDFVKDYRSSWLSIGIMGSMACCNGDTWASEIGTVVGKSDPFLITSRKRVPRGTNGGISWLGLLVSALGGLVVGLFHYVTVRYTVDTAVLERAAPQWPIIIMGMAGGLIGSIIDSILGATLQYSGINEKGIVVERPGKGVKHISGRQILDNHSVNLLSSIIIALTLPRIANLVWPY
ncbi:hypothetical protein TKK_0006960 [Trichogramma kaykai]